MRLHLLLASALLLGACTYEDATDETAEQRPAPAGQTRDDGTISVPSRDYSRYDATAVRSQRLDPSWREFAERDWQRRQGTAGAPRGAAPLPPQPPQPSQPPLSSDLGIDPTQPPPPTGSEARRPAGPGSPSASGAESFETLSPNSLQAAPTLPVPEEGGGSTALRVQILLDRARFSPGVLDGYWGKNSAKAVYWFQRAKGMNATGQVDRATWDALSRAAGPQRPFLRQITLTAEDVQGPFTPIPEDVYEQAKLDCLCYSSPLERIAERSHSSTELLQQLNPQADLENLTQGATLWVPDVPPIIPAQVPQSEGAQADAAGPAAPAPSGQAQRLVISKRGFYLQGLDAQGNILFHLPSTLGSGYDPSPGGEYKVTLVKRDPDFRYQPKLFHEVPDTEPEATLPPGPNSPVGLVWIAISKPHYGIHGTAVPDTIGYTSSHGCVRLTNWDALFLADHVRPGMKVEFVD
ncbi:MAG TPA: L,D-transpeptidase family protein [Thermoanaerobaculia bacterium]